MSGEEIDRLVQEHSLHRVEVDDEQIAGYWAKSLVSFADGQSGALSSDSAFQLIYTAGLQATLAVLAAHGLRVRAVANHYMAFHTAQQLSAALREQGRQLDTLRMTRHASVYEPNPHPGDMDARLVRAIAIVRRALPVIRSRIVEVRPDLGNVLGLPPGD